MNLVEFILLSRTRSEIEMSGLMLTTIWMGSGMDIDLHHLLFPLRDDAGDVFVEFVLVLLGDKRLSPFDGKHDVYVALSVGVWHGRFSTLLTLSFYKLRRLLGLGYIMSFSHVTPLE